MPRWPFLLLFAVVLLMVAAFPDAFLKLAEWLYSLVR